MSPKIKALLIRGAFGVVVSTLIGYTIKGERIVDAALEEKYNPKKDSEETS